MTEKEKRLWAIRGFVSRGQLCYMARVAGASWKEIEQFKGSLRLAKSWAEGRKDFPWPPVVNEELGKMEVNDVVVGFDEGSDDVSVNLSDCQLSDDLAGVPGGVIPVRSLIGVETITADDLKPAMDVTKLKMPAGLDEYGLKPRLVKDDWVEPDLSYVMKNWESIWIDGYPDSTFEDYEGEVAGVLASNAGVVLSKTDFKKVVDRLKGVE